MIKTLPTQGNSEARIIDKPILELLEITINTPLKIINDVKGIIISPVKAPDREERFQSALEKANSDHGETFRKLGE